jgi:CDP-diacylglycerol--glycerol-3-phosphate 3-phosphatidyltransferase
MFQDKIVNLPNALSLVRIISIPLLVVLGLGGIDWSEAGLAAAGVFALASLTDFLDGYLARKTGQVTRLGRFLDPVADKLLVSAALIMLIAMERAPGWVVYLIIGREIAVTALRAAVANAQGLIIEAAWLGKWKTACQMVAILGLLINETYFQVDFGLVGLLALYAALGLTLVSGYFYFKNYWRLISRPS